MNFSKQFAKADRIVISAPYWDGQLFGIKETELIYAEYLDIEGNNAAKILAETIEKYVEPA